MRIGICESGLDQLQLQKRDLMNGVRKENIVAWWLDEIDKSVNDFLLKKFVISFLFLKRLSIK
jgi:hypothetical protein